MAGRKKTETVEAEVVETAVVPAGKMEFRLINPTEDGFLRRIVDCDWLCSDGVTESEPALYYSCIPEIPENYQCLEIVWD